MKTTTMKKKKQDTKFNFALERALESCLQAIERQPKSKSRLFFPTGIESIRITGKASKANPDFDFELAIESAAFAPARRHVISNISISYDVPLIPQPTDLSCWAASLAMVVSYRDSAPTTPQAIASTAGMNCDTGYNWDSIKNAVTAWNLQNEGPACALPEQWASLLRQYGPLWIVEVGNPNHAVVVTGIQGDGTVSGTTVNLNNPWPPNQGAVEIKAYADFEADFELAQSPNAQIVHK